MSKSIEFLKQVKDFRKPGGQRHPLWFILLIAILGFMTGHLGYRALGDFAKAHQEILTQSSWGLIRSKTRLKVSSDGIPFGKSKNSFNHEDLLSP